MEGVSDDLLNQYKELSYKYGRTDTNPEETGNKHTYHNIRSKPPHNNESREQNGSIYKYLDRIPSDSHRMTGHPYVKSFNSPKKPEESCNKYDYLQKRPEERYNHTDMKFNDQYNKYNKYESPKRDLPESYNDPDSLQYKKKVMKPNSSPYAKDIYEYKCENPSQINEEEKTPIIPVINKEDEELAKAISESLKDRNDVREFIYYRSGINLKT